MSSIEVGHLMQFTCWLVHVDEPLELEGGRDDPPVQLLSLPMLGL